MSFAKQLAADALRVEQALASTMPNEGELDRAARYAVLQGGKRLRAHLVYEGARIFNVAREDADAGAMAIEMIHAYSLVHDDLPAMDDDDLRRGQPTVHKAWNESTAILVGDLLQSQAFAVLSQTAPHMVASLADASAKMVYGQYLDIDAEGDNAQHDINSIYNMQSLKTGALIEWSASFGAAISANDTAPFTAYAQNLGLAFQIWDDVLDVEASSDELGKATGKDTDAGKATTVELLGLAGAKSQAQQHIERAKAALNSVPNAEGLRQIADFAITRRS